MTRSDLLAKLARALGKNASTLDTLTQTRLLDALNNRHRELLGMPGAEAFRRRPTTLTSVVDQARYALAGVEEVFALRDTSNDRVLGVRAFPQYRRDNPDPATATGTPEAYVVLGYQAVAQHPSNASEVFLKSTSASDTQTAYVEGTITGGYPRAVSVTLTGTTAVSVSATITTWERLDKVYLASAAVGVVTVHEDSGAGTELARIGSGQTSQRYYVIELDPTPSEALTYQVDASFAVTDLAQSTDEPWLPSDFHDLLIEGALRDELLHLSDERYPVADQRWRQRMSDLKLRLARQAVGAMPGRRTSRLGAWVSGDAF
jgi:hypothetical protein